MKFVIISLAAILMICGCVDDNPDAYIEFDCPDCNEEVTSGYEGCEQICAGYFEHHNLTLFNYEKNVRSYLNTKGKTVTEVTCKCYVPMEEVEKLQETRNSSNSS